MLWKMDIAFTYYFQLDGTAFESLAIDEQNYEKIDTLILDNNNLESLPNKLLRMKLNLGFSVQSNKLTSVSIQLHFTFK